MPGCGRSPRQAPPVIIPCPSNFVTKFLSMFFKNIELKESHFYFLFFCNPSCVLTKRLVIALI